MITSGQIVPNIKVLSPSMQDYLLSNCNAQYRVIVLMMLDAGLRVSETVQLQVKHINTMSKTIFVNSLKKRKAKVREVPMSERLVDALTDYWKKLKNKNPDAYLFPAAKSSGIPHKSRKSVWRRIKAYTDGIVHPHMLRHTCASRIVGEQNDFNGLMAAKEILGHEDVRTTQIYTHISREQKIQAINGIERRSWINRVGRKLFPPQRVHIVPVANGLTTFHVGRKNEMEKLADLATKKVNTIILGAQGIGKTHLLDNYNLGDIIRLDEFRGSKTILLGILEEIRDKRPERMEMTTGIESERFYELKRKSTKLLVELMIAVTKKQEFTIIIDDLTRITPTGVAVLEKLKNHFHIICAARQIPVSKGSFLSNFERIDLKPLSRAESMELIGGLAKSFHDRISDWEAFKNHIWECTDGNPLFIYEMMERYQKEPDLSEVFIKDIRHSAAKKEINFLPFFIGIMALMSVMRYWGRITGTDSGPWYFLAAIGMVFLFFGREIIKSTKRKYV